MYLEYLFICISFTCLFRFFYSYDGRAKVRAADPKCDGGSRTRRQSAVRCGASWILQGSYRIRINNSLNCVPTAKASTRRLPGCKLYGARTLN